MQAATICPNSSMKYTVHGVYKNNVLQRFDHVEQQKIYLSPHPPHPHTNTHPQTKSGVSKKKKKKSASPVSCQIGERPPAAIHTNYLKIVGHAIAGIEEMGQVIQHDLSK